MNNLNPKVDRYLIEGCMRCKFGGTPACKVNNWREELETLREIVLQCGLEEEVKWGVPCYTAYKKNILIVSAFKDCACISFFKGALLNDQQNILLKQGQNSQSARIIKYNSVKQIIIEADIIKAYIREAIDLEKAGQKVEFKKNPEPLPEELKNTFTNDPAFEKAFYALTPGRQRGYIIYFSQPKNSETKLKRIEKSRANILNGIGLNSY